MDGQADMVKLTAAFCNFANAPNKAVQTELMMLISCLTILYRVFSADTFL
jgi:hypothetical protein